VKRDGRGRILFSHGSAHSSEAGAASRGSQRKVIDRESEAVRSEIRGLTVWVRRSDDPHTLRAIMTLKCG
jgi:hypothetical protein